MNLSEWANEALADEPINLCRFNYERDKVGGHRGWLDETYVRSAFDRFDNYLSTKAASADADHCANVLESFSKSEISNNSANAAAYLGQKTKAINDFLALKNLRFLEANSKKFGLTGFECEKVAETIKSKMTFASYDFDGNRNLNTDARRMVDRTLNQAIEASRPAAAVTALSRTPSLPPGSSVLGSPPTAPDNWFPIWLTEKATVYGLQPPPDADDSQYIRSVYVAGLKDQLGLYYSSDLETDENFGASEYLSTVRFRMKVLISMKLSAVEPWPRQPCLFSLGDKSIYVSRKEPNVPTSGIDSMPGRTVHLQEKDCLHTAACKCNRPGLPEAVMPECTFLEQEIELVTSAVLFERDLRHHIGTKDEIRMKNPL